MSDDLGVLTAIYQSDRTDRSTTLTVSLATMGAAVTYLVGTIAFYDKLDLLGWTICLLPFPLVCVAAFHAVLLNLAAVRARSILTLERVLLDRVPEGSPPDRREIGVTASERAGNLHTAHPSQRAAILIAYGGVAATYLGYVVLMLVKAARHMSGWIAVPVVAYVVLLVPVALAWRHSTANFDLEPARTP
ncbi:hypothetical protein SAMN05216553_101258 [Lentzea fradiae]|uniref:Uncharacterized protein n=1 Tax=Lentzea fradiae TaxID=200378 RepID=A0A1G7KFJ8_9PSEU|nr:hypothetical protein [Lentzea fradiae]SDF36068.1 hypothetical protein SAMN05216553_101258 [Lentzea fradiae]